MRKPKFRRGQKVIVTLRGTLVRRFKKIWYVDAAGMMGIPCYIDELRPLTRREIGASGGKRK